MKKISDTHIVLQCVNNSAGVARLQSWPLASGQLSNRVDHLNSMPRRPQHAVVRVKLKKSRGRRMVGVRAIANSEVERRVRINVHERNLRINATVSTFLPVGLEIISL